MTLHEKLTSGRIVLGALATNLGDEALAAPIAAAGYDFVMYDCEHGVFSLEQTARFCRAARLAGISVLVRCHLTYPDMRHHLDMGPEGLILPMVEDASQVELIRDAAYLPPVGRRGPGGPSIEPMNGVDRDDWIAFEEHLVLLPQIETRAGLDNMEILDRPWITGALLGPYDLLMSMELTMADFNRPGGPHDAAIKRVIAACRTAGKPCGMVCGDADGAQYWIEAGCRIIVCGEVLGMLGQQAQRNVAAIRLTEGRL